MVASSDVDAITDDRVTTSVADVDRSAQTSARLSRGGGQRTATGLVGTGWPPSAHPERQRWLRWKVSDDATAVFGRRR